MMATTFGDPNPFTKSSIQLTELREATKTIKKKQQTKSLDILPLNFEVILILFNSIGNRFNSNLNKLIKTSIS